MTVPRNISPDQDELITLCERVAMLPQPIHEGDLCVLLDEILPILDARARYFQGDDHELLIDDLIDYAAGLRNDGHELAADGLALLMLRWGVETERRLLASNN